MNHLRHLIPLPVLLVGLLLAGCASSTVQSRRQERPAAYEALPTESRELVDQGQIKAGMGMDAVYIAWGKPGEVLKGGNETGETVTWDYFGTYLQEIQYWGYRRLRTDFYPVRYLRIQVVFANGVVKQWQTFPAPGY
jgi:hypothetical protein